MSHIQNPHGRTTRTLLAMLEEVHRGEPNNRYAYIGELHKHTVHAMTEFHQMLMHSGVESKVDKARSMVEVFVSNSSPPLFFHCIPASAGIKSVRGIQFHGLFVDELRHTPELYEMLNYLKGRICEKHSTQWRLLSP